MLTKISAFVKKNTKILLGLIILLSISLAFVLGLEIGARFFQRPPILIKSEPLEIDKIEPSTAGSFVASVNGKYYYPVGCSYANRIKPENQIFFQTEAEAQSHGLKPWPGCFK